MEQIPEQEIKEREAIKQACYWFMDFLLDRGIENIFIGLRYNGAIFTTSNKSQKDFYESLIIRILRRSNIPSIKLDVDTDLLKKFENITSPANFDFKEFMDFLKDNINHVIED